MKLSEYLAANRLDPKDFAPQVGVTTEAVRLWVDGKRRPREKQMTKIAEVTKGLVQPNDFYASAA